MVVNKTGKSSYLYKASLAARNKYLGDKAEGFGQCTKHILQSLLLFLIKMCHQDL